ncbi:hypothetical protein D1007_17405 [Hordeum vulgare]|nr:hypothetical protein D1007_17405 [Hordeum vulgare]
MPIRCAGLDMTEVLQSVSIPLVQFPSSYLGMPLSLRSLKRSDYDNFTASFDGKLAGWMGSLLSKDGRLALARYVLAAILVYMISVHPFPNWLLQRIDKRMRAWVWRSMETCNGGHCRLNWLQVCKPLHLGGLGIPNMQMFGTALRLRWLWSRWDNPARSWSGIVVPCSD